MPIDTCWHLVHLAFNFQLTTHSKLTAQTITTSTMLFIPIYMLLASISIIVNLTSTLVVSVGCHQESRLGLPRFSEVPGPPKASKVA